MEESSIKMVSPTVIPNWVRAIFVWAVSLLEARLQGLQRANRDIERGEGTSLIFEKRRRLEGM
jgi:hypothetical protein